MKFFNLFLNSFKNFKNLREILTFSFFSSLAFVQTEQAANWQYGFQIPASPAAEGILNFHHDLFLILVIIIGIVFWAIYVCISTWNSANTQKPLYKFSHASVLEMIWTIIPAVILTLIAGPSFVLLYSIDEIISALISFKIIGHQWYWSYENISYDFLFEELKYFNEILDSSSDSNKKLESINDFQNFVNKYIRTSSFSFDSYMLNESDLTHRSQRLFKVDNKLYVPIETNVRFLVSSSDVIHSWAIPSLGIKLDACPGRLNQTSTFINRPGNFVGQCSEICGINHGFMPISVGAVDLFGTGEVMNEEDLQNIASLFKHISVEMINAK